MKKSLVCSYKVIVHSLKEYNIHHISNETIVIQSETGFISLTAFDLEKKYYQRFHVPRMPLSHMESVVGSSPGNIFHILLAHNPNYLKTYADWGSDLVLAGHFHGGNGKNSEIWRCDLTAISDFSKIRCRRVS